MNKTSSLGTYFHKNIDKLLCCSSLQKQHQSQNPDNLVSIDFKTQQFHKFLQNIVTSINQHNLRLISLENQKISVERVVAGNRRLIDGSMLKESVLGSLENDGNLMLEKSFLRDIRKVKENKSKDLQKGCEESFDGLANIMKLHAFTLQHIYQKLKQKDTQISQLTNSQKYFQQLILDISKKQPAKSSQITTQQHNKLSTKLSQFQQKSSKLKNDLQNQILQLQKKTLWKITQCQSLLSNKITPDYVQNAVRQLEHRIYNTIKNDERLKNMELESQVERCREFGEKFGNNFREFQKQVSYRILGLENFSRNYQIKIEQNIKLHTVQTDKILKNIENKTLLIQNQNMKFSQSIDRIGKFTQNNIDQIEGNTAKIKGIQSNLQELNKILGQNDYGGEGNLNPHKLCHIDGELRRIRDLGKDYSQKLQNLQQTVRDKFNIFQQRILTVFMLSKTQDNYPTKQQLSQSLTKIKQPITQKLHETTQLITELTTKLNKFETFEKSIRRKLKEIYKNQQFLRILDTKMNTDIGESYFNAVNAKMQEMGEKIHAQILEKFQGQFNKRYIEEYGNQQGSNIIGLKNKPNSTKCLGCGSKNNSNQIYQNNFMMGTDGKLYKVDLKNSNQENFLTGFHSQVSKTGYDNTSSSTIKKGRIITGTINRPNSSKSNIRPSSAHSKCL